MVLGDGFIDCFFFTPICLGKMVDELPETQNWCVWRLFFGKAYLWEANSRLVFGRVTPKYQIMRSYKSPTPSMPPPHPTQPEIKPPQRLFVLARPFFGGFGLKKPSIWKGFFRPMPQPLNHYQQWLVGFFLTFSKGSERRKTLTGSWPWRWQRIHGKMCKTCRWEVGFSWEKTPSETMKICKIW